MIVFGNKKREEAVISEISQLHDKQGITLMSTLTSAQKRASLMYTV